MINVTAAVIEKDGKYLIARRKKGSHLEGFWEFPGGKIEDGETPEECLARELFEEFDIDVLVGEFIAESVFSYPEKTIKLLGYRTEYVSGNFKLNDHSEIKWVSMPEMDEYDFASADLPIIEALKKQ